LPKDAFSLESAETTFLEHTSDENLKFLPKIKEKAQISKKEKDK